VVPQKRIKKIPGFHRKSGIFFIGVVEICKLSEIKTAMHEKGKLLLHKPILPYKHFTDESVKELAHSNRVVYHLTVSVPKL